MVNLEKKVTSDSEENGATPNQFGHHPPQYQIWGKIYSTPQLTFPEPLLSEAFYKREEEEPQDLKKKNWNSGKKN